MMASSTIRSNTTAIISSLKFQSTPVQGALNSAGAGITGGYTGDSLSLRIIIAFLLGLSLYNAIELIVLILVTFNRYRGIYFWSMIVAGVGVIPYSLGFLIKFFQLLDPNGNVGYVAIVLITIGWYTMVTGQSVVLWSRLHLLTNSRRVIRYTLYVIIIDAVVLHIPTTVLTFGSNSNSLTNGTLSHFVHGYNIMEKIQMVGFFIQELILSLIYIRETLRLLKLSESVQDDITSVTDEGELKHRYARKTMYQLLAINAIIISMDIVLLGVEFANLYLIETTLKGVVYSIKLKLEFAVLGKLVQIVNTKSGSNRHNSSGERRGTATGLELETSDGGAIARYGSGAEGGRGNMSGMVTWPDFVDPSRVICDVTHAPQRSLGLEVESRWEVEGNNRKRRYKGYQNSWIDEEMDKHNIG